MMLNKNEQAKYAQAYFIQAQVDRDFALRVYDQFVRNTPERHDEFFCCIVAHCQQAIEKATKGFLLRHGATFRLTHQVIDWIFHTKGQAKYKRLLKDRLDPRVLAAAIEIEKLAPTLDSSRKNTEYPYLASRAGKIEIQIPAKTFKAPEVIAALKAARMVVAAMLRVPNSRSIN